MYYNILAACCSGRAFYSWFFSPYRTLNWSRHFYKPTWATEVWIKNPFNTNSSLRDQLWKGRSRNEFPLLQWNKKTNLRRPGSALLFVVCRWAYRNVFRSSKEPIKDKSKSKCPAKNPVYYDQLPPAKTQADRSLVMLIKGNYTKSMRNVRKMNSKITV